MYIQNILHEKKTEINKNIRNTIIQIDFGFQENLLDLICINKITQAKR